MKLIPLLLLSLTLILSHQASAHSKSRRSIPAMKKRDLVHALARFTGRTTESVGLLLADVLHRHGMPNAYIRGRAASGAFVAGLRYGHGRLYTSTGARRTVHWAGPSVGYDFGGDASQVFFLVYHLRRPDGIYGRYPFVEGSGYFVGGGGLTMSARKSARKRRTVHLVPVRLGVGLRLGANMGYIKMTRKSSWNPF